MPQEKVPLRYILFVKGIKMDRNYLLNIATLFLDNKLTEHEFINKISQASIDVANIDVIRKQRLGFDEVIFGESKTLDQILKIIEIYKEKNLSFLCTKLSKEKIDAILTLHKDMEVFYDAGMIRCNNKKNPVKKGQVAIVTAGTSDLFVAEEASITLDTIGVENKIFADVGVAGVHRFFNIKNDLDMFDVLIVAAGMEGALPSLVGGLISKPVIAVPVSAGYGTALNGFTALFAMLTSCANGITVVNINNGFGAAIAAYRILSIKS